MLTTATGNIRIVNREPELAFSAEALIVVIGVIATEGTNQVACIDRSTEPLIAVIEIGVDFNIFNRGAGSDSPHRETVDLVPFHTGDGESTMTDGDVAKRTGIVRVIGTTVECRVSQNINAFNLIVGSRHVRCCFPEDDHAAPEAAVALIQIKSVIGVVQLRRENDGIACSAFCIDLATTTNNQRRSAISRCNAALLQTLNNCSRLNCQRSAVIDKDEAVKHVGIVCCPRHIRRDVISHRYLCLGLTHHHEEGETGEQSGSNLLVHFVNLYKVERCGKRAHHLSHRRYSKCEFWGVEETG